MGAYDGQGAGYILLDHPLVRFGCWLAGTPPEEIRKYRRALEEAEADIAGLLADYSDYDLFIKKVPLYLQKMMIDAYLGQLEK